MSGRKLLPCPFCGGPAEQQITDGPKRGYIGCFSCMIGIPFNVPYGEREREAWNARVDQKEVIEDQRPLLSSEVAAKIARHIQGKNADYFLYPSGLAELEFIIDQA